MAKKTIYRKDYKSPDFLIDNVSLDFDLGESQTIVKSKIQFIKNNEKAKDCILLAEDLIFISVSMNGELLSVEDYILSKDDLIIKDAPDEFVLEVENSIDPSVNTQLEGLYASSGNLCTQCEPEGFRRITYYPDRSDVMAKFTVRLEADKEKYPVLLSNGNLIVSGDSENGKHYAIYEDPFKKPSYLFALVAGKLDSISDKFVTMSGKEVDLHIYCNSGNAEKCRFTMEAIKKAMKWDEEVFGREYDLNIFNLVAVDDFNAGAMENKSLNIFNSSCVLADSKIARDMDYSFIERIVAHEYFHNWSGDRVTCQSWFELTLKEGFTVFREQSFCQDIQGKNTKRILDVIKLRNLQLPEDFSPMAHSIRPESYMQINNFYTKTIYSKGAEVIRMMQTLLGKDDFRKATDLYFGKFDGQAVTCDDFVSCMEEVSGVDLTHFKLWYSQAGTPVVNVETFWDKQKRTYSLTLSQKTEPTNGQSKKRALYIPVKTAILDHEGNEMELIINGESFGKETVLTLDKTEQEFIFEEIHSQPALSLFRGFSAPVILNTDLTLDDYAFLMEHDSDGFNRWESSQKFAMDIIMNGLKNVEEFSVPQTFFKSFKTVLEDNNIDDEFKALMLKIPSETEICNSCDVIDPDAIHAVREKFILDLSIALNHELMDVFGKTSSSEAYEFTYGGMARRSLHNLCLSYLCATKSKGVMHLAESQYFNADNMTDQFTSMAILADKADDKLSSTVLDNFYDIYKDNNIVVNKWFIAQAFSQREGALERVKKLKGHEAFNIKNPNNVRALIGCFAMYSLSALHNKDGSGYRFLADCIIELNAINPHVAADIIDSICSFAQYDGNRKKLMVNELRRIKRTKELSSNLTEKIDNALKTV